MTPMLMMVLMMVRILPKVINDHDDGGGGDFNYIDIRHLTSTIMRMTTRAIIDNDTDYPLSRTRCLANQG